MITKTKHTHKVDKSCSAFKSVLYKVLESLALELMNNVNVNFYTRL